MVKENGKTTLFTVSDSGNYPNAGEEAFTKKVISTVISNNGIEALERVVGVGPGRTDDKQFNSILNGAMEKKGFVNFEPHVKFSSLQSYLNSEDSWAEFKQDEWVGMDSYLVHQDDVKMVREIKSSSSENEIQTLLGDFTKEKALQLVGSVNRKSSRDESRSLKRDMKRKTDISPHAFSNQLQSKKKEAAQSKDQSRRPWIVAGVLLMGSLALLCKVFNGKSTS